MVLRLQLPRQTPQLLAEAEEEAEEAEDEVVVAVDEATAFGATMQATIIDKRIIEVEEEDTRIPHKALVHKLIPAMQLQERALMVKAERAWRARQ